MAKSRFALSDEIIVDQLKLNAKNKNTTKSTQTWLNVWEKWANETKVNPKLEEDEHEDLDKKFKCFTLKYVPMMDSCGNLVHVVILQKTASNCFKVRAARAARLLFLTRPIKFLICGVNDAFAICVGGLYQFMACNN